MKQITASGWDGALDSSIEYGNVTALKAEKSKLVAALKAMMAEFEHASCGSFGDAAKVRARAALKDVGE